MLRYRGKIVMLQNPKIVQANLSTTSEKINCKCTVNNELNLDIIMFNP